MSLSRSLSARPAPNVFAYILTGLRAGRLQRQRCGDGCARSISYNN
jgi:hypothetical protein